MDESPSDGASLSMNFRDLKNAGESLLGVQQRRLCHEQGVKTRTGLPDAGGVKVLLEPRTGSGTALRPWSGFQKAVLNHVDKGDMP